jgi:hypothetical protein
MSYVLIPPKFIPSTKHPLIFHTTILQGLNWDLRNLVNVCTSACHLGHKFNLSIYARWVDWFNTLLNCLRTHGKQSICSLHKVCCWYISAIIGLPPATVLMCLPPFLELRYRSLIHWMLFLMLGVSMIPVGIAMIITRRASVRFLDMDSTQNLAVLDLSTRYFQWTMLILNFFLQSSIALSNNTYI